MVWSKPWIISIPKFSGKMEQKKKIGKNPSDVFFVFFFWLIIKFLSSLSLRTHLGSHIHFPLDQNICKVILHSKRKKKRTNKKHHKWFLPCRPETAFRSFFLHFWQEISTFKTVLCTMKPSFSPIPKGNGKTNQM